MAKKVCKVQREVYPNPCRRGYDFNVQISDHPINDFWKPMRSTSQDALTNVGPLGTAIVAALLEIDGVTKVVIQPYHFTVEKAPLFSWGGRNGIERKVVRVLRSVLKAYIVQIGWVLASVQE